LVAGNQRLACDLAVQFGGCIRAKSGAALACQNHVTETAFLLPVRYPYIFIAVVERKSTHKS
jgi:hypothetical protein